MMSPNPPKIAHSPLSSQLSPSFLALVRAVRTNPASTLARPRRINKDVISRRPPSWLLEFCPLPARQASQAVSEDCEPTAG